MNARDEILARVRAATTDVTSTPGESGPVQVIEAASVGPAETLELFAENVADYRATVIRAHPSDVGAVIADTLGAHGASSVVVPAGLDPAWRHTIEDTLVLVSDTDATTPQALDALDAVVTAASVGIATTGTIILDHGADQGRRELTLVPDIHVCVIRADQIVHDVPEAVTRLRPGADGPRPLTWISGPSATSDIELQRVEGVHGPRTLVVILVTADDPAPSGDQMAG